MTSNEAYQRELLERETRQKHLDSIVQTAMAAVAKAVADSEPRLHHHLFYGASAIHPRHLSTWFIFPTDADQQRAQSSGLTARIDMLTRQALIDGGYPAEVVPNIFVSFTTHETVQREANGNYFHYFK